MATVVLAGYFALGTGMGVGNSFQEVSGGSYVRIIVNNSGTYSTGTTQTISTFAAATTPVGLPIRLGAIYDASTAGNLLAYWEMPFPLTASTTALPSTVFNLVLSSGVIAALSTAGNMFAAGSQIGTMCGNPLIAGNTLIGGASGALTYEPSQGGYVSNQLFMNSGVPVGRFNAAGDLLIRGQFISQNAATTITASSTLSI